jgi:hypothetical protein
MYQNHGSGRTQLIDRRRNARVASHLVALFAIVASIFAGTVGPIPVSAQPVAPIFSINGDSVGPVTVADFTRVPMSATGLTPSADFSLIAYNDANCSMIKTVAVRIANSTGEWTGDIEFLTVTVLSYQVVDSINRTSNCVVVNAVAVEPPVLSIDGDAGGPITIVAGTPVTLGVAGLTPSADFTLVGYSDVNCTAVLHSGPYFANGDGGYSVEVTHPVVEDYSYRATDSVKGNSNCISVNVTAAMPPVLSINGDTVGPVTFVSGSIMTVRVTGLTPNSNFMFNIYASVDCSGIPVGLSTPPGPDGEYAPPGVPFTGAQIVSLRMVDVTFGESNCVGIIVTAPPVPVLSIEGDSVGPVELVAPATAGFHITGLTANTSFTLNVYNGTDCSVYADGGPNPADANGEFISSAPYGGAQTVSYQAVDNVNGTSNCVAVIVAAPPAPVLSIEGDSEGPVEIVSGTTADFRITGLTASTSFTLNVYNGTDCVVYADGGPNDADASGEFNSSAPYGGPQTVSYMAIDTVAGASNCVTVIVTDPEVPPALSFNGDAVGPVQVTVGGFAALRITGLTPSTQFSLKEYSDTNCTVTALEYLLIANGAGEHQDDWPANSATSYSYQATDFAKGTSNCVAVIVTDPAPTPTTEPTVEPTVTPEPTAEPTTTPEPEPIPDTSMSVTGDPRFPISGQVSIPGFTGLTYTLNSQPSNGTVTVQPDGTFTYSAESYLATFDSFTVLATAADGETAMVTVTVTLVIDPTVPTYGEVGDGGTGYGGDVYDPRNSARPNPTAVPEDDDDGSGVEAR